MVIERLISAVAWLLVGSFTAAWLGIMLSAAAVAPPIVGFVMTIGAALVVFAVKSSVEGRRVTRAHPPARRGYSLILR